MSKIGNQPVEIPDGVEASIQNGSIELKGQQGAMQLDIPKDISVKKQDSTIVVERLSESKKHKSLHGLIRSLIANAVRGVKDKWEKKLEVVGTGYRVRMQGQDLVFEVGLSHNVTFNHVEGIDFKVEGNKITISGIDKQLVGEVAYKIKSIKKPDAYKGKGIRYEGEILKLKPGKKAKTVA